jgi:hypothetical protein
LKIGGLPDRCRHLASVDARGREFLEKLRPRFNIPISHYATALVANQHGLKKCEYPPNQIVDDYEATFREIRPVATTGKGPVPREKRSGYMGSLERVCTGRSLFVIENGCIGVGPRGMRAGDLFASSSAVGVRG